MLSENGELKERGQCLALPSPLLDIWPPELLSSMFDKRRHPILSPFISDQNREKLANWKATDELDKSDILDVFEDKYLVRPRTWRQLMLLWEFVSSDISRSRYHSTRTGVRILLHKVAMSSCCG